MIAFSCVHCGLRMAITEEGGSKRAQCEGCGQTVVLPATESGLRRSGRHRRPAPPPDPTRIVEPPAGRPETRVTAAPRAPESPTRADPARAQPDASLTGFLAPAQAADEIGRL